MLVHLEFTDALEQRLDESNGNGGDLFGTDEVRGNGLGARLCVGQIINGLKNRFTTPLGLSGIIDDHGDPLGPESLARQFMFELFGHGFL